MTIEYSAAVIRAILEEWHVIQDAEEEWKVILRADMTLAIAHLTPSLRVVVEAVQIMGLEALDGVEFFHTLDETGRYDVSYGPAMVSREQYEAAVAVLGHILNKLGLGEVEREQAGTRNCLFGKVR